SAHPRNRPPSKRYWIADPARTAVSNGAAGAGRRRPHRRSGTPRVCGILIHPNRMRALVTGASGFVGAAVARALVSAGWQVRVLVRAASDRTNLQNLPLEIAVGDLTVAASLQRALAECDAPFHVADDYRLGVRDPSPLYQTNVEGTRNLLTAAADSGVKKIVYTSSVATMGIAADGSPGDEQTPVSLAAMIGHYKRSKFLAEQLVLEAVSAGTPAVIVNPSTPVGPGG